MLKFMILTILAIELCGCVQVTSLKTSNNGIIYFLYLLNINTIGEDFLSILNAYEI